MEAFLLVVNGVLVLIVIGMAITDDKKSVTGQETSIFKLRDEQQVDAAPAFAAEHYRRVYKNQNRARK